MSKTKECKCCHGRFRTLTNEDYCFYCHTHKYKTSPNPKQFGNNEVKETK